MIDADTAFVMTMCRALGVTVHIRGTDDRPVIEVKDRRTRRIVGGIDLKRRADALAERRAP